MNTGNFRELTAVDLADAFRRRSLSPLEATRMLLEHIEQDNPTINAFCHVGAADALVAARQSEKRWLQNSPLGPLDGIPVSIKDFFKVRGWPTRRGSRTLASTLPDSEDAPAVGRLREAGAILIGKTTTTEMGHKASGISPLTGITRNPWNPEWTSGGSSCGAGAAAAAGLGPIHLGSDAAGSIRIPASFCAVYGHKPTSGLVPAYPPSASGHLAVLGPITRTVADARQMLQVIMRRDTAGWRTASPSPIDFRGLRVEPKGLKLAWADGVNGCRARGDVLTCARTAVAALAEAGAVVDEVELRIDDLLPRFLDIWNVFVATSARSLTDRDLCLVDTSMRDMIERGRTVSGTDFNAAYLFFSELTVQLNQLFQEYDAVMLPTLPSPPFAADAEHPAEPPPEGWLAWAETCFLFNATTMPASSIPCGFLADGKPVAIQIVGPAFTDEKVMAISDLIEAMVPLPRVAPNERWRSAQLR